MNDRHKFYAGLTALILLAFVLLLLPENGAAARGVSVYTIAKVKLDVRAKNAVLAKRKALKDGPLQALRLIFKRFAPFRAYDRLSNFTLQEADDVIDGFAVRSERNSSTRYLALLDYNFSRQKLQALLIKKGVPFFDRRSGKQVLMPVFSQLDTDKPGLKHKKNWWRAWRTIDLKHALTDTRLYKPKTSDNEIWQKINDGDHRQYEALRERYGVRKLILIEARLNKQKDALSLRLFGLDNNGPIDYTQLIPVTKDLKQSYEVVANIAFAIIEGRWREPQISGDVIAVTTDSKDVDVGVASKRLVEETVFLRVTFRGLRDWQQIRKRLRQIPGVQKMKVNSLSPRGADVRMSYPGGIERLQTQFSSFGFDIQQRGKENVLRSVRR